MPLTGINGFNREFQDFARFAADMSVSKRTILRTDGQARVIAGSGDFIGNIGRLSANRDANNAVRASFLLAVEELFGGAEKVPAEVREAMQMENFGEQGKPLSVRRVRAVTESVTNHLANLRAEANGLLEIALDRAQNDDAFVEVFSSRFDGAESVRDAIANGTPAELKKLIDDLRACVPDGSQPQPKVEAPVPQVPQAQPQPAGTFQRRLDNVPDVQGTIFNEESGNQVTSGIYDPDTGRTYDFREYIQGGARGDHCFFLSSLHHLGAVPSQKNACALREIFLETMAVVAHNTKEGKGPVAHGRTESSYLLDGNDISELFDMYARGKQAFGKNSTRQADVSFGALLPSLLKRPVVMVCFPDGGKDGGFKTFSTDIQTGVSYADAEPVYIHYRPGHFQALERLSVKEPTGPLPKDMILNELLPDGLRNTPCGKALGRKIFQSLESRILFTRGRQTNAYLVKLVQTLMAHPELLASAQAEISQFADFMTKDQDVLDPMLNHVIDGENEAGNKVPGQTSFAERLMAMVAPYGVVPPQRSY